MKQSKLLSELANIKLGLAFKKAVKDIGEQGEFFLIQTKDITPAGEILFNKLSRVRPEISPTNHTLETGDILLRLRGPVFSSVVFNNSPEKPTLATNQIAVIRCNPEYVEPHYMNWYLNSTLGQRYFNAINEGTGITKISAKMIANMRIETPSLEDQKKIEEIQRNWLMQKSKHSQLIKNGNLLFNQICMNIQEDTSKI